jgi:hypothetical protein
MRRVRVAIVVSASAVASACGAFSASEDAPPEPTPSGDASPDTNLVDRADPPDARDGGVDARFATVGVFRPQKLDFVLRYSNTSASAGDRIVGAVAATEKALPVTGRWSVGASETPGWFEPGTGAFHLVMSDGRIETHTIDVPGGFDGGTGVHVPFAGDWDGNGTSTCGLYDATLGVFYARDSNTTGAPDRTAQFGPRNPTGLPLAGDWDGDGIDSIGLFLAAPAGQAGVFLRNSFTGGIADVVFNVARSGVSTSVVTGDWNGTKRSLIGLYEPATATFSLLDRNDNGAVETSFGFGGGGTDYRPIAGEWLP